MPLKLPFNTLVASHPHMHSELPLVHTSVCEHFKGIVAQKSLKLVKCKVFKEPLLYLFYGRPAYRSRRGDLPTTDIAFCPILFVLNPISIPQPYRRVFPFDSGAAKGSRFSPYVTKSAADKFLLEATTDQIRKLTHMFFDSIGDYFVGRPKVGLKIKPPQSDAAQYYSLITHKGKADFDERRSAIEVQTQKAIQLANSLSLVIFPTPFFDDSAFRKRIMSLSAEVLTYTVYQGSRPSDYYGVIRHEYERWLKKQGLI